MFILTMMSDRDAQTSPTLHKEIMFNVFQSHDFDKETKFSCFENYYP